MPSGYYSDRHLVCRHHPRGRTANKSVPRRALALSSFKRYLLGFNAEIMSPFRCVVNCPRLCPLSGLELPFMMMPHPLIPVSLPPASVTMAMSQMNHLSTIANMAAAAQGQSAPSRMVTSVIKVTHGAAGSLPCAHFFISCRGGWGSAA